MISLTLTDKEADVVVNSLREQLQYIEAWQPEYDYLSMTYHTIYDMVRQQQRSKSNV